MEKEFLLYRLRRVASGFAILVLVAFLFGVQLQGAGFVGAASAPNIIGYQGRVLNTNSTPIASSTASMKFELYDALTGGTCVWSNSSANCDTNTPASTVARTVTLTNGLFSEQLGDTGDVSPYAAIADSVFGDNAAIYLQVYIESETLTPRKQLLAAPYALNAETVDGIDSSNLLQLDGTQTATGVYDFSGAVMGDGSPLVFEGATDDDFETSFTFTDPTADRVITFQDADGTVAYSGDLLWTDGGTVSYLTSTTDDLAIGGSTVASAAFAVDVSANQIEVGTGSTANAVIVLNASDADEGTLTYTTDDRLVLTGGGLEFGGISAFTDQTSPVASQSQFLIDGDSSGEFTGTLTDDRSDYGGFVYVTSSVDPDGNVYNFTGFKGIGRISGSNAANSLRGVIGSAMHDGSGIVTTAAGLEGLAVTSSGTLTSAFGVLGSVESGGGSIGTAYGGRFDAISEGTNRYGVFAQASGGTANFAGYFSGSAVHIEADSTPDSPTNATGAGDLYVEGDVEVGDLYCTDCLDFSELSDTLSLDASTSLAMGTNNITFNLDSTGDFLIQDNGSDLLTIADDSQITYTSGVTNSAAFNVLADTVMSGFGQSLSVDALTSGIGLSITTSSADYTSAKMLEIYQSGTHTTTHTVSGDTVPITRTLGMNAGGETMTVTGSILSLENSMAITAGTVTDSSSILEVDQNYASASGHVVHIASSGTGSGVFVDQNGNTGSTFDDTAGGALHITNTGNQDYGLTVYTNEDGDSEEPLVAFTADNSLFDSSVLRLNQDGNATALVVNMENTGNDAIGLQVNQAVSSNGSAVDINAETDAFIMELSNDGDTSDQDGISISACEDTNPSSDCDFILFRDGNGTTVGAVEGDGAGGVTNASSGSDYAELFPGVYADFAEGDVVALNAAGQIVKAIDADRVIGALSIAPNVLGNWRDGWRADGDAVPVALLGQVPVNVTDDGGAIVAGDYLALASEAGVARKATGAGYVLGRALEGHSSGDGTIMVFVQPKWQAVDVIVEDGSATSILTDLQIASSGMASAGDVGVDSNLFTLRGSGFDGSVVQDVDMGLLVQVDTVSDYRLSVLDTAGSEVAYVNQSGDLALAGRLYPSDRGVMQTDKYIYYDGSSGPGGDLMRTNAGGWGTGSYDFAEMFPSDDDLQAGEVVVFAGGDESVKRSDGDVYDKASVGVISTRPGFVAGENIEGHFAVALAGRVPTLVTDENGAIAVGDPITTSSKAGYAMKATESGVILGYAMEAHEGGEGSIVSFVRVSYFDADDDVSAVSSVVAVADLNTTDMNVAGGSVISVGSISGIGTSWAIDENGNFTTEGQIVQIVESYQGEDVETYAALSREATVSLSGTSDLKDGFARVDFDRVDPLFNDVISNVHDYRVFLTADSVTGQLYVRDRDNGGFVIQEVETDSDAKVDWMVVAYHKDYAPVFDPEADEEIVDEEMVEEVEVLEEILEEEPVEEVGVQDEVSDDGQIVVDSEVEEILVEEEVDVVEDVDSEGADEPVIEVLAPEIVDEEVVDEEVDEVVEEVEVLAEEPVGEDGAQEGASDEGEIVVDSEVEEILVEEEVDVVEDVDSEGADEPVIEVLAPEIVDEVEQVSDEGATIAL